MVGKYMAELLDLVGYCDRQLNPGMFSDYCPNGLQVESGLQVRRLVTGVTASLQLIEAAAAWQADALLVHHGYFWKGEPAPLTGMKGRRIRALFEHGISLIAYHLPLDAHPELGNNKQLGRRLEIANATALEGEQGLIWQGELASALSAEDFAQRITDRLGRVPLLVSGGDRRIRRVAWCTGGAQKYIEQAAELDVDAYLTGEVSEATVHVARECGVHFYAAGHHATERYGVQALGVALGAHFDLEHRFIDIENPV
jgi:dinuclear metal center YbgI/SA1388 family protein